jgi:RsiW-degrading membrane proteinase PrsW (M82 family)
MAKRPGGAMIQNDAPTRSQLIPLLSKWGELGTKSQLVPMFVTIAAVLIMFVYADVNETITIVLPGNDPEYFYYTSHFIIVVATYLTLLSLHFIYRLVGKRQSWVGLLACMAFTSYYLWVMATTPYLNFIYEFFHKSLAGGEAQIGQPFFTQFYRHFVGTGFFEESVKALPLLIMVFAAAKMGPGLKKHFRLEEPLDGIVYGAAAGGGFAIMETVGQYVSRSLVSLWETYALIHQGHSPEDKIMNAVGNLQQNGIDAAALIHTGIQNMGTAPGVQLLIPRSLDEAFGHMAYSGYFGYFIGLSVLKPEKRWKILFIGLCSAALPHALWDSIGDSQVVQMTVALLSFGLLAAAILKAREISPNRSMLQPSMVFRDSAQGAAIPAPAPVEQAPAPVLPPPAPPPTPAFNRGFNNPGFNNPGFNNVANTAANNPANRVANAPPPPPPDLPEGTICLRIGPKYLIVVPGLRILDHQAPGLLASNPGGPVAEVTRNPHDPNILGLTNLSQSPWDVVSPNGTRRSILTGQTIKLAQGTHIDFGPIDGEVR